jgi:D-alanyl-lipoteichoic acid acyltransferase DltB (MBOAT superfamily)
VVLAAAICFSFQIFCDFSGYSDIAVGSAQVIGFRLTRNFNRPFQADSMAEYWKRWHISLSNWMRDYIFYPLCGRRPGIPRICASIMLVFLANGLWHGARWNYLISGFLHGSYRVTELVATRAMSRRGWSVPPFLERPARLSRMLLVFTLMTFAFVFFRGQNLPKTLLTISSLFHGWSGMASRGALMAEFAAVGVGPIRMILFVALIGMVQAVQFLQRSVPLRLRISAQPFWLRWSFYYSAGVAFVVLAPVESLPFIYFQF